MEKEVLNLILPKTLDFFNNDMISIDLHLIKNAKFTKGIRFNHNANKDLDYSFFNLMIPGEGIGVFIILDECTLKGKELKFKIEKEVIEDYASHHGQIPFIYYS